MSLEVSVARVTWMRPEFRMTRGRTLTQKRLFAAASALLVAAGVVLVTVAAMPQSQPHPLDAGQQQLTTVATLLEPPSASPAQD